MPRVKICSGLLSIKCQCQHLNVLPQHPADAAGGNIEGANPLQCSPSTRSSSPAPNSAVAPQLSMSTRHLMDIDGDNIENLTWTWPSMSPPKGSGPDWSLKRPYSPSHLAACLASRFFCSIKSTNLRPSMPAHECYQLTFVRIAQPQPQFLRPTSETFETFELLHQLPSVTLTRALSATSRLAHPSQPPPDNNILRHSLLTLPTSNQSGCLSTYIFPPSGRLAMTFLSSSS